MKLQTKVLFVLFPLALACGAAILLLSKETVNTILIEGVAARGFLELTESSQQAAVGIRSKDEKSLLPVLHNMTGKLHASYAMALDVSGTVLAHTNVVEKGKAYGDPVTRRALRLDGPGSQQIEVDGKSILDIAVPVWAPDEDFLLAHEKEGKSRLGTVRMGLPLQEALATQAKILRRIAFILLTAGGIALLLIVLFLRKLLLPVRMLSESTDKIAHGRYDVTIPVESKDELGELAHNFNEMSRALAVTTDYLNGVIRSIADILLVTDSRGKIRTINRAALELLGYSEEELTGKPALRLFDSQEKETLHIFKGAHLERLVRTGFARDMELDLISKAGKKIPVLLSGSVLKNRDGQSEGLVIVAKDLTERRRLELMLVQSEKLSAVGQLAAGVAHEINNPLGIILGFAQSATKRIQASDVLSLPLRSIEREALRCKNLVQNLLAFSRQNKAKMEAFDLNETVQATLSIIEAQARVKSVEVFKELGALEPLVGDKNQLQQVIVNLCSNAIDAMPNGGRIVVRTRNGSLGGDRRIIVEVEDNGSGISEDIRDKIFNPFFTTKEVGKGTGLGLSLVYEIVQRHKGTIEVRSTVGRGTTFTVFLPTKDLMAGENNETGG